MRSDCFLIDLLFLSSFLALAYSFECEGNEGVLADPEDCRAFYVCDSYHSEHYSCGETLLFDEKFLVCNFDYVVDCGDRPIPGVSTTSTPLPITTTSSVEDTSSTTQEKTENPTTVTESTEPSTFGTTSSSTLQTTMSTSTPLTTTTTTTSGGYNLRYPDKILGIYVVLADDTEDGFGTDADWEVKLYPWQQQSANVLFFTFVNPETMKVPKAFEKLAATRGTDVEGAVPKDTLILFAIGGYAYSQHPNPWQWLTSKEAAEAMAVEVATWPDRYGIDGIDLDIEEGAGNQGAAGPNLVHFVRKLRSIKPDIIIGQPTYGYPQVEAANDVINESWDNNGNLKNVVDSIGIMVYEGTQSLMYVKNFVHGTDQWEGFPIKVDVNPKAVMLGCKGSSGSSSIMELAREAVQQDLLGIMVWYASVPNGLQYAVSWDASLVENSQQGYIEALQYLQNH